MFCVFAFCNFRKLMIMLVQKLCWDSAMGLK